LTMPRGDEHEKKDVFNYELKQKFDMYDLNSDGT